MDDMQVLTEQDGHQLAVQLVRELAAHVTERDGKVNASDSLSDDEYDAVLERAWQGDPSSILRRYLERVQSSDNAKLQRGFFALLTDYVGGTARGEGAGRTIESYDLYFEAK